MPSNRARINADLVPKTQYNVPPNKTAKKPLFKPQPLPKFKPLYINNQSNYSLLNLPFNINPHDPFRVFSLFFTDKIMDKFVEWTNKYAELYPPDKEKEHPRAQQLIYKQELYAYFSVLIYIGITIELCIEDY